MIGLIVDGDSDEKTIPILANKILQGAGIGIKPKVVPRGHKLNVRKMQEHINDMAREQPNLEKIIVCMDSEEDDLVQLEGEVKQVERQLVHKTVKPKYVLVVRMLESWLLADEDALRKVLRRRARVKPIANPEAIRDPKEKLKEIFQGAGKTFQYTRDDPKIAEAIKDVSRIRKKCPRFDQFCEAVIDP